MRHFHASFLYFLKEELQKLQEYRDQGREIFLKNFLNIKKEKCSIIYVIPII